MFVHGKGGPETPDAWLQPLNAGLTAQGYPRLEPGSDRVIAVRYLDELLAGEPGEEPPSAGSARPAGSGDTPGPTTSSVGMHSPQPSTGCATTRAGSTPSP